MPWGYSSYKSRAQSNHVPASSNWRYLTEDDFNGPMGGKPMMPTMEAKKAYNLTTNDICGIQGYRRKGSYTTRTLYFDEDLQAAAERKHGVSFVAKGSSPPEPIDSVYSYPGGVTALSKETHSALPLSDLHRFSAYRLEAIAWRCPHAPKVKVGDALLLPTGTSKAEKVKILKSLGYDYDAEKAFVAPFRAAEKERADKEALAKVEREKKARIEAAEKEEKLRVKRREKLAKTVAQVQKFEAGELQLDNLTHADMVFLLNKMGEKASGKLEELREQFKKVSGNGKRGAGEVEGESEGNGKKQRKLVEQ